jgi:hypothetical protein
MTELKELLDREDNYGATFLILALAMCLVDVTDRRRPHFGNVICPKCGGELRYFVPGRGAQTISAQCASSGCLSWSV